MSKNPKVSILTITYNHEKYIRQTLDGFLAQQTDFDIEIIVADDSSTDRTQEIVKEYSERHPHIFKPILRSKNIGAVSNSISTLQAAKGKYIALCEGDDYWTDPKKLQIQVDFLDEHSQYVGCFHRAKVIYENAARDVSVYPDVEDEAWYTIKELLKINYIPTNAVVYRRQDYNKLPQDILPFDWYLHLYHARFGAIKFIDKTMSVYRKHEGGIWWDFDKNRDKLWQKYGLSYLALWYEVLKLYKSNQEYKGIIEDNIENMFGALLSVDERNKTRLFDKAMSIYPEKTHDLIKSQHKKLEQKEQEAEDYKIKLLELGDQAGELVRQNRALAEDLAEIRNTRTWRARSWLVRLGKSGRK